MKHLHFTILDVDGDPSYGVGSWEAMTIPASGFDRYVVTDDTLLTVENLDDGRLKFTQKTKNVDLPTDLMSMTKERQSASIMLVFDSVSSFVITHYQFAKEARNGRKFLFGGESSLVEVCAG